MRNLLPTILVTFSITAFGGVKVRFDPASPAVGPFPTDALTVADPAQKTGLRVNLPMPGCSAEPNTCAELAIVNQLDGFSLEPRLRVRFSGPVDPHTLQSGILILWLNDLTNEEFGLNAFGSTIGVNRLSYDPATNTVFAEPDQILSQHRRYAVIVTSAVRDTTGNPVEPDPAFLSCLVQQTGYCDHLALAVGRLAPRLAPQTVVGASVFTTLSATAWLEKAHSAIQFSKLDIRMASPKAVFSVAELAAITLNAQTGLSPTKIDEMPIAMDVLTSVGSLAFGSFASPQFIKGVTIAPTPTGDPVGLPQNSPEIFFTVYLPATPPPASGYPAVIVGHGNPDSRFAQPHRLASTLASRGLATIAINAFGFGYGPLSTLVLTDKSGGAYGDFGIRTRRRF